MRNRVRRTHSPFVLFIIGILVFRIAYYLVLLLHAHG
jgi:hypothetical protein